ncbi:MAG: flagellar hook-associated protein FlgL [Pseudomonadota bacterium]
MRVSTANHYRQSLNQIMTIQQRLAKFQSQVATGQRIETPGDDPAGMALVMQIEERAQAALQFARNGDHVEQRLNQVDSLLDNAIGTLQRVRDLTLQGRSEQLSSSDRAAIAQEIRERLSEFVDIGNARNAVGEYIFSGAQTDTRPFTEAANGTVNYLGDQVRRELQISEGRALADGFTGDEVFMRIRNGNGTFAVELQAGNTGSAQITENSVTDIAAYLPHDFRISFTGPNTFDVINDTTATTVLAAQPYVEGAAISFQGISVTMIGTPATGDEFLVEPSANQSVFETFDNLVQTLTSPTGTATEGAVFGFNMDRVIEDIDQVLSNFNQVRAIGGARLNTLFAQQQATDSALLHLETLSSQIQDADLSEAVSLLAQEATALEAAQAAFARVQSISLFNFI